VNGNLEMRAAFGNGGRFFSKKSRHGSEMGGFCQSTGNPGFIVLGRFVARLIHGLSVILKTNLWQ
jgi:hypothetical protein